MRTEVCAQILRNLFQLIFIMNFGLLTFCFVEFHLCFRLCKGLFQKPVLVFKQSQLWVSQEVWILIFAIVINNLLFWAAFSIEIPYFLYLSFHFVIIFLLWKFGWIDQLEICIKLLYFSIIHYFSRFYQLSGT